MGWLSDRKRSRPPLRQALPLAGVLAFPLLIAGFFLWTRGFELTRVRIWLTQVRELRSAGLIGEFEKARFGESDVADSSGQSGRKLFASMLSKAATSEAGEIGILNALEYSDLLAAAHPSADFSLLYHSSRTGEYLVFFPAGHSPSGEGVRRVREEGRLVPNANVSLQSLKSVNADADPHRQLRNRERDPREVLQWYAEDWSDSPGHRFPLSLDQKYPALQLERFGEVGFWMSRDRFGELEMGGLALSQLRSQLGRGCENHEPLTARTAWIQNWYMERMAQRNKLPGPGLLSSDFTGASVESLDAALILHDTLPDLNHPELAGVVYRADELGFAQKRGVAGGHGTHGAGVVAAARNQIGGSGIAPGAKIIAFSLSAENDSDSGLRGSPKFHMRDVIPGLSDIKRYLDARGSRKRGDQGARVLLLGYAAEVEQLSQARPLSLVLEDILYAHDVLVVAPSGNRVDVFNPQKLFFAPSDSALRFNGGHARGFLLPVAASDVCSRPAWFSHVAEALPGRSFFAPGQGIYSTFPNSDYGYLSGSSSSASVAAGIALALSDGFGSQVNRQLNAKVWGGMGGADGIAAARSLAGIMLSTARVMQHNHRNYMLDSLKIVETVESRAGSETFRALAEDLGPLHSMGRLPLSPQ